MEASPLHSWPVAGEGGVRGASAQQVALATPRPAVEAAHQTFSGRDPTRAQRLALGEEGLGHRRENTARPGQQLPKGQVCAGIQPPGSL